MKKFLFFSLLILGLLSSNIFAQEIAKEENSAMEIIKAADKYRGSENWRFDLKVVDFTKEGEDVKVLTTNESTVGGRALGEAPNYIYKSLVEFTSPKSELGKKMLMDGQIYWMFFPNTNNLVRITAAQRLAGQATAADIASINYSHDYTGEIAGTETIKTGDGEYNCYKLKLTQKNEDVAYASLNYWVEKETYKPIKVEYFAATGVLLKIAYYRDFKETDNKQVRVHELFIVDPIEKGRVTRMLFSNYAIVEIPEYLLRKDSLPTAVIPK